MAYTGKLKFFYAPALMALLGIGVLVQTAEASSRPPGFTGTEIPSGKDPATCRRHGGTWNYDWYYQGGEHFYLFTCTYKGEVIYKKFATQESVPREWFTNGRKKK